MSLESYCRIRSLYVISSTPPGAEMVVGDYGSVLVSYRGRGFKHVITTLTRNYVFRTTHNYEFNS